MWWRRRRAPRVFEAGARPGRRAARRDRTVDLEGHALPLRRAVRRLRATVRRIWPDVTLVLLAGVVVLLLFPGIRRGAVAANPLREEPPGFMPPLACTEPVEQGASLAEYPPAFACDDRPATFFATDTNTFKRSPRLWVDFAKPVDLTAFHITVGQTSTADVLSSEALQKSGRPAHVCLRFYTSEGARRTDYLYDDKRDDKAVPLATVQIPRSDGGPEAPDCPRFTSEIADDTEEHRYTFDEVKGVLAVGVEIRDVHPVRPGTPATHVFVSGIEFFGHPAEAPPVSPAPAPAPPNVGAR
jgi:hypothetical protein